TWRAVSARMDAPRGARKNCCCQPHGFSPKTSRTHSTGSIRWAHSLRGLMVFLRRWFFRLRFGLRAFVIVEREDGCRNPRLQFWFVIKFLDQAFGEVGDIKADFAVGGAVNPGCRAVVSGK